MNAEVLEKLKKILALANCAGATQGEMESALLRAKEIATKHNIDLASVDMTRHTKGAAAIDVQEDVSLKTSTDTERAYHVYIFRILHDVFDVEVLYNAYTMGSRRRFFKIYIVGEAVDVAISVVMFPYLEKVMPQAYRRALSDGVVEKDRADKNGFYCGMWQGIVKANYREKAKLAVDDANKCALIVRNKADAVKDHMAVVHPKVKQVKDKGEINWHASIPGRAAGETINLRQLGGNTGAQIK